MGEGNGAKNTLSVESKRKKKRKWKERRAYCCEIQSCTRGYGLITKQFTRRTRVLLTRVSLCTWMRSPKCGIVCCRKQPPPPPPGLGKVVESGEFIGNCFLSSGLRFGLSQRWNLLEFLDYLIKWPIMEMQSIVKHRILQSMKRISPSSPPSLTFSILFRSESYEIDSVSFSSGI